MSEQKTKIIQFSIANSPPHDIIFMTEQEDNFVKAAKGAIDRATLTPTMNLRWVEWKTGLAEETLLLEEANYFNARRYKLQQEWIDQTGQSNWRDIPIAEEESKTKNHECKVCGKPFENSEDLYEHYDQTHNKA